VTGTGQRPTFAGTVAALLRASRLRARGRRKRRQQLVDQRAGRSAIDWALLWEALTYVLNAALHVAFAFVIHAVVAETQVFEGTQRGEHLRILQTGAPGLSAVAGHGLEAVAGSLLLLLWCAAMILQGSGIEFDTQRRRHPMWEWYFSHPVRPAAVFVAEMLAPLAENPVYATAPLFLATLFGITYGAGIGILAALVCGIPVAIALACASKALETVVLLRVAVRSRGAVLSLTSAAGTAIMFGVPMVAGYALRDIPRLLANALHTSPGAAWPLLSDVLGDPAGARSALQGGAVCLAAAALLACVALGLSAWATQRGLVREQSADETAPRRHGNDFFTRAPLYRKELLWLLRDRGAIVQVVVLPLGLAGLQLINLRTLFMHARSGANAFAALAVVVGTYFLAALSPRSLMSEGVALWIPLTWPVSLERLLRTKAVIWWQLSWFVVGSILLVTALRYPGEAWKVIAVALLWLVFGRTIAEKGATLARATATGEQPKTRSGARFAMFLGFFPFVGGVLADQWNLVVVGIVYSYVTAMAMWQNLRARLPYLEDPWSERLPQAPTLMHAMIAISGAVEVTAIVATFAYAIGKILDAQPTIAIYAGYAVAAPLVCAITIGFLEGRSVTFADIWYWGKRTALASWRTAALVAAGIVAGVALAGVAHVYWLFLAHTTAFGPSIRDAAKVVAAPYVRATLAVTAVLVAPFAEEYLFRGLLYRTLDSELGGWRAVAISAAFFMSYHPLAAWPPVFALGVINALLYKRTGQLTPCVATHAAYNALTVILT
jgi:membrane protease YdiL (CAAX protease family)